MSAKIEVTLEGGEKVCYDSNAIVEQVNCAGASRVMGKYYVCMVSRGDYIRRDDRLFRVEGVRVFDDEPTVPAPTLQQEYDHLCEMFAKQTSELDEARKQLAERDATIAELKRPVLALDAYAYRQRIGAAGLDDSTVADRLRAMEILECNLLRRVECHSLSDGTPWMAVGRGIRWGGKTATEAILASAGGTKGGA